jgi:toxin ParE1/3/4
MACGAATMRRKVRISGPAGRDLSGIFAYVSGESPQAAERLADLLDSAIQDLAEAAEHFAIVPSRAADGIRRRVVGSYNVFYRLEGNEVMVMRILHGARDATHLLFPET